MKNKFDHVSIIIAILSIIALINGSFVYIMKNRVSKMAAVTGFKFIGTAFWIPLILLLVIIAASIIKKEKFMFISSLISSAVVIINFIFFIIGTDNTLIGNQSMRVSFGLGFYFVFILLISLMIRNSHKERNILKKYLPIIITLSVIVAFFALGLMDKSSIMIEYHTRKDKFISTLYEHLYLCWSSIVTSVLIGIPLSYACYKDRKIDIVIMGFLNVVRSVPAIALIMIMITPLSLLKNIAFFKNLGVSSFGFTPVYCALVLYSLFIIISNITSALRTIDGKYIQTARGIGFTNLQILYKLQFPLILPVFISGLKVTIIFNFTAAALGTMVGFGGLGTFIVMGSGNAVAIDLILLGAIPIMIFIFLTNFILTLVTKMLKVNSFYGIKELKENM